MCFISLALLVPGLLRRLVGQRTERLSDLFTLASGAKRLAELLELGQMLLVDLQIRLELTLHIGVLVLALRMHSRCPGRWCGGTAAVWPLQRTLTY